MFHADLCGHLGIVLEDGIKSDLGGVVGGAKADLYFHRVKILIGGYQVTTMAGFSKNIAVAGLLGRRGFFEDFVVKIDSSTNPPYFDLEKINRT
jgi:hypothetical protein